MCSWTPSMDGRGTASAWPTQTPGLYITPRIMEAGPEHKRARAGAASSGQLFINGSGSSGAISGKAKPCLKFFSTCGCPYGEGCHFSHYVAGGISALGLGPGNSSLSMPTSDAKLNLGSFKTRVCNQFGTPDGCRFGDKCHFAHGERELCKVNRGSIESTGHVSANLAAAPSSSETSRVSLENKDIAITDNLPALVYLPREPSPPGITTSLEASSAGKGSIKTTVAGSIIGKGEKRAIEFTHLLGAIWDHKQYSNLTNIAIEGTFDHFKTANQMLKVALMRKDPLPPESTGLSCHKYKTKLCENFARGTCTFGERCHFAHGDAELLRPRLPT